MPEVFIVPQVVNHKCDKKKNGYLVGLLESKCNMTVNPSLRPVELFGKNRRAVKSYAKEMGLLGRSPTAY